MKGRLDSKEKIKSVGGLPRVHCENVEIHRALYPIYSKRTDAEAYYLHRPPVADEVEISTVCAIANSIGCPVYIVHLNNANGIDIINDFRARGAHIELETCLHYLVVDQSGAGIKHDKIFAKTSPPPRTKADLDRLWWGIKQGFINHVGSDHGAQTKEEKLPPGGNIWNVTMGGPYVQEVLPIMLSEGVNKRGLSLQTLVETCSRNNAIVQGMYPRKGTILPDSDADLVIVDLKKRVRFTADLLKGSSGYSLVEDWNITGWPIITILRGKVVMESDQLTGNQGDGIFVKCTPPFAR
jgi:dihydropyrimidinase